MTSDVPAPMGVSFEPEASGDTLAFIVRIWRETAGPGGQAGAWRGSIERVGAGVRLYFTEIDSVARFIREQAGLNPDARRSAWSAFMDWLR